MPRLNEFVGAKFAWLMVERGRGSKWGQPGQARSTRVRRPP